MKKTFDIKNMTCNNCANHIEKVLSKKVDSVKASFPNENAIIEFNPEKITESEIIKIIKEAGYEATPQNHPSSKHSDNNSTSPKKNSNYFGWGIVVASFLIFAYVIYGVLEGMHLELPEMGEKTGLVLLFLVGLLTGFHCVAMCGGFMVSYTAKNAVKGEKGMKQHLIYGLSKTVSYTIIGGIFGLIGSIFLFTPALRGGIGIFAGIFMVFYALSMFGFKFFRRFQFNPKFLSKIATKKHTGKYSGPMLTGLANGLFIACGPLQAMYIYATGLGNPLTGAISLTAFGLGTLPVLIGFGGVTNAISHNATKKILKFSAVIVLILGLIMLNRGLSLTGSGYDLKSLTTGISNAGMTGNIVMENGYQVIKMDVVRSGYSPDSFVLQKGVPVKWEINGKELTGCNRAIQVPKLDLKFDIKEGMQTIEFTPKEVGTISWSCWMGMIPGTFIVTDDGTASKEQINVANQESASNGGSCGMGKSGGCGCGG